MFTTLYANQFKEISKNPNATRSSKLITPIHAAIGDFIRENSNFDVITLPLSEYNFVSSLGTKKVDIAILDKTTKKLLGAVMFKGIRQEYNKNANNYYESMKGESSLFIEAGIPVFQIVFIPTYIKHKNSKGEMVFEEHTEKSFKKFDIIFIFFLNNIIYAYLHCCLISVTLPSSVVINCCCSADFLAVFKKRCIVCKT